MSNNKSYWFNHVTNEYEYIVTPVDFSAYLPQEPTAQNLYRLYQKIGDSPLDAAIKVLHVCVGTLTKEDNDG